MRLLVAMETKIIFSSFIIAEISIFCKDIPKEHCSESNFLKKKKKDKPDRTKMPPDCVSACIDFGAGHVEGQIDGETDDKTENQKRVSKHVRVFGLVNDIAAAKKRRERRFFEQA